MMGGHDMPGKIPLPEGLYTIGEAADKTGFSIQKLRRMDTEKIFKTKKFDYGSLSHRVYDQSDIDLLCKVKKKWDIQKQNERALKKYYVENDVDPNSCDEYIKAFKAVGKPEPALPLDPRFGDWDEDEIEAQKALTRFVNVMKKRHGWKAVKRIRVNEDEHSKRILVTITFD
jgi:hypothetical protein